MKYSENYVKRLKGRIKNLGKIISDYNNKLFSLKHSVINSDGKLRCQPFSGSMTIVGYEESISKPLNVDELRDMVLRKIDQISRISDAMRGEKK